MPIGVNGSGTITGISVGGLPDGIVDTDMLAATAVTAAKRGAGSVLQIGQTKASGAVSATGSSVSTVSGLAVTMTPIQAGSKFLLTCTANGHTNLTGSNGNHGCRYLFYASIDGGAYESLAGSNPLCATHIQGDLGNWLDFPVHYSFLATPTYDLGEVIIFRPAFTKDASMGDSFAYYFNHNTASNEATFIVQEIAT